MFLASSLCLLALIAVWCVTKSPRFCLSDIPIHIDVALRDLFPKDINITSHKARKKLDQANQSEMDAKLREVRTVLFPEPVCFGQRWPQKSHAQSSNVFREFSTQQVCLSYSLKEWKA